MHAAARKRLLLFLACAVVLLGAGYGWGYSNAHDEFYAPESLLQNELISLDFNNRQLHYANLNLPAESRRELLARLREEIAFVNSIAPQCRDAGSRREAEKSVGNAKQVMDGHPLSASATASTTTVRR